MKSEERHQLLTNDLGVVTTKTVGFFERHSGTLIAVVCGVLAISALNLWWNRSTGADSAAGWTKLDSAGGLEELGSVVDKFKGKPPGQWAQLQIAEKTLQSAMPLMFSSRELALADIKRSSAGFESLLQEKNVSPTIRERALWGVALCLESACDGDTSKPVEAFDRLIREFPDSIFKPIAEDRIASLKKSDSAEFYKWFSKEKPEPPEIRPRDVKNGINLPAPAGGDLDPNEFEPIVPMQAQPPKNKSEDSTSESKEGGKGEAKPAEKPAEEKPAGSDKPADPAPPVDGAKPTGTDAPKDADTPKKDN